MKKHYVKAASSTQPRSILRSSNRKRYHVTNQGEGSYDFRSATPAPHLASPPGATCDPNTPPSGDRGSAPSIGSGSDPFRARGLGPNYTSNFGSHHSIKSGPSSNAYTPKMNYFEASPEPDLSPLRADYSLSPLANDLSLGRVTSPVPFNTTAHSGGHADMYASPAHSSRRDYNSNVLSPTSTSRRFDENYVPASYFTSPHEYNNELNKSNGSNGAELQSKGYHREIGVNKVPDTPRVRRVRDDTLRQRMSEDDVRSSPRPRAHSAGDPLRGSEGYNENVSSRGPRSPSAPANLNHSTVSPTGISNDRYGTHSTNISVLSAANRSVFTTGNNSTLDKDPFVSRSIMSGEYRVRDPNRSALSSVSMRLASEHERSDRLHSTLNYSQSLSQDPLTHRRITNSTPNGAAKLLRDHANGINQSRNSIDSKSSQNQSPTVVTILGKQYGVASSLVSLLFMSILSLVLAFIAAQLLFRLNSRTANGIYGMESDSVLSNSSYDTTQEVTIAITTFVFMLDICCLVVCSLQFFFAAKLVRFSPGEERCFKYLEECAVTRFIAVTGFFVSIPALLLAFLLYMLMEYHSTSAIISIVILTVGILFVIAAIIHSTYSWRIEKDKADKNIPPYDKKKPLSQSELSTLV